MFPKVVLKVYYGHKSRNKYITQEYPSLTLDTKIKSLDYCWGTYYSDIYKLGMLEEKFDFILIASVISNIQIFINCPMKCILS